MAVIAKNALKDAYHIIVTYSIKLMKLSVMPFSHQLNMAELG